MKIAQLAPLWERVPPRKYGGTELVVSILSEELIKRGHEVTLFACGDSVTNAELDSAIASPMRELGITNTQCWESIAIAKVIERQDEFDVIHNHLGYAFLPYVDQLRTPVVTTLHGAFTVEDEKEFCKLYKDLSYISISESQRKFLPCLNYISTVYNGIEVDKYSFQEKPNQKEPYLAFLGRLSEEKGVHLAIQLAKETGYKLKIAGKIDVNDIPYYENKVKHLIDNEQIVYIGELGHNDKVDLLKNAVATIHPVTWPEPFGLVMAESMACGTPVLALNQGSIPEVIFDKVTGFVENDIDTLIKRVDEIKNLDRYACRRHVQRNFSESRMIEGYLKSYRKMICNNIKDYNALSV